MTVSRATPTGSRIRLLIVTGAAAHEHDTPVCLPSEQAERFRMLPRRFDATLVVKRSPPRPWATTPLPEGIRVAWIDPYRSKWRMFLPRHFFSLWKEVRSADAVMSLLPVLDGIPLLALAALAGRPRYVYVIASSIYFRFGGQGDAFHGWVSRVLLNICALISRRVFVHGRGLTAELWRPLRGKVTEVIISTVSAEDFVAVRRAAEGPVEILTVCRLVPSKRVDVAIDMTRLLLDRGIDVRLTVVGDGPLGNELNRQVEALSLSDRVVFTGLIDDRQRLREQYRRADIFVLCTEIEGVSMAIQEAMAAGLPVVSTDRGALAQFLNHDVDSLVVHDIESVAFADAVAFLASSDDARERIARAGQRKMSRLGNAAWVDRVADVIERDMHQGSRGN